MGAYGSPELYPPEPQNSYPQYSYKPKTHRAAFFFGGFLVGVVIVNLFALPNKTSSHGNTIPTQAAPPASSYSSPVISSAPIATIDSQEYLKNWAESSVAKCLVYPESALFPKNDSDWLISQQGEVCTISSVVSAKGKNNVMGKSQFVVKIQYYDMYAQVTLVQIDGKVDYDITKAK